MATAARSRDPFEVSKVSREAFAEFRAQVVKERAAIGFPVGVRSTSLYPDCVYRGHASNSYALLPTLLRVRLAQGKALVTAKTPKSKRQQILSEIQDLESQLFYEFLPRGRELVPETRTDWDMLFLMRHHAVATRLLDWTQSLGVALYFSLCDVLNNPKQCADAIATASSPAWRSPRIWLANPFRANKESWSFDDIISPRFMDEADDSTYGDWLGDFNPAGMGRELPVFVYPESRNARLQAQSGLFSIHMDLHEPLDQLFGAEICRSVDLPHAALPAALEFLGDAGLCESRLFPDLDALARDLHLRFGVS